MPDMEALARQVVELLDRRAATVATAESLTGGMLGSALTAAPGASRVYRGGVVAYATDLKHQLLGVDADLLALVGAVDPEVAVAMARGVLERLGADFGVSTTGVAGPDPQHGQPPGTVWVAVAASAGGRAVDASTDGDRQAVRRAACIAALVALRDELLGARPGQEPATPDR